LALIAGLAQPDGGQVRLGGIDLADGADSLRTRIAWVGQHPHIFAGTVGSNVSMQRPGVTALAVERAISVAGLDRVHHATPGDSLGEGGAGLSGGELVRMSLARAAAAPDAGLLLADEPSAHLDRASAAAVTDALLALAHGRTLLVATHDLALAARMDRTIDLDALKGLVAAARRAA
jgi:ATP-binding cassette subfamily C protein CydD